MGRNIGKNLSNIYRKRLLDHAIQSISDALKAASKKTIHKKAEANGDLIGNKISDKIKKSVKNFTMD